MIEFFLMVFAYSMLWLLAISVIILICLVVYLNDKANKRY